MQITVIIPTYRRPHDLVRCLTALQHQTRLADEVLVVVRDSDTETQAVLKHQIDLLPLRQIQVMQPGVVAAMNMGVQFAKGDVLAFTDDDAAPHPNWLEKIEALLRSNPQIGGVGGRDWVYHGTTLEAGASDDVGRVQWFGRVIGNHHIGCGNVREVDVLKGVNMSIRRSAITDTPFDDRMRGDGAQVHYELAFSLQLKRAGWKLAYDPQIAVDHYPAKRFDLDQRQAFNETATRHAVCNETLALLDYFPSSQRITFLIWAICIGTQAAPGLAQGIRLLRSQRSLALPKLMASLHGRWLGWQTWRSSRTHVASLLTTHTVPGEQ